LFIGDSLVEGEGASTRANRWIDALMTSLRSTKGIAGSGLGLTPASEYGTYLSVSSGWKNPASGSGRSGQSWMMSQGFKGTIVASGGYVQWTVSGDSADLVFTMATAGYGNLVVAVDGVTVKTIVGTSGYAPGTIDHFSLGTAGSHTIRVTASGGDIFVDGIVVYNGDYTAGLTYWDCAHTSFTASDFAENTDYQQGWTRFLPHLVITDLVGGNEYLSDGESPTVVADRLTTMITTLKALASKPTIYLMVPMHSPGISTGPNGSGYTFAQYCTAAMNAATAAGASVLDLRAIYPTPTSAWFDADALHPNNTGHAQIASAWTSVLTA
jgi:hypothetical protein